MDEKEVMHVQELQRKVQALRSQAASQVRILKPQLAIQLTIGIDMHIQRSLNLPTMFRKSLASLVSI